MMYGDIIVDNELNKINCKNQNDRLTYLQRKNNIFRKIFNFFCCKKKEKRFSTEDSPLVFSVAALSLAASSADFTVARVKPAFSIKSKRVTKSLKFISFSVISCWAHSC